MLVLTRKVSQSINIGGDIEVTVLEVRGEYVRLGIKAPKTVFVSRPEVTKKEVVQDPNREERFSDVDWDS